MAPGSNEALRVVSLDNPAVPLPSARPTCLVVDPHPALVDLVAAGLEDAGFEVVAHVTTADAAIEAAVRFHPDVVVGDPDLASSDGRPVLGALHAAEPAMRIVAFADAAELGPAETAMVAGVDAIVAKQSPLVELVRVTRDALAGEHHVGPAFRATHVGSTDRRLTTSERLTLRLLADGLGYREIASRLGVAPDTVRVHATKARKRLGAATRTEAVATALRAKLID
jgi:two-component system, NarL family, response regulator DesR